MFADDLRFLALVYHAMLSGEGCEKASSTPCSLSNLLFRRKGWRVQDGLKHVVKLDWWHEIALAWSKSFQSPRLEFSTTSYLQRFIMLSMSSPHQVASSPSAARVRKRKEQRWKVFILGGSSGVVTSSQSTYWLQGETCWNWMEPAMTSWCSWYLFSPSSFVVVVLVRILVMVIIVVGTIQHHHHASITTCVIPSIIIIIIIIIIIVMYHHHRHRHCHRPHPPPRLHACLS